MTSSTNPLLVPPLRNLRGIRYPIALVRFTGSPPLPSPALGYPLHSAPYLSHAEGTRFVRYRFSGTAHIATARFAVGWRPRRTA